MIVQLSTGAAVAMTAGPGLKTGFEAGNMELRLYSGTMPADANDSIGSATILAVFKNGSLALTWDGATAGQLVKPAGETWSAIGLVAQTATFGRFVHAADTGAASTVLPRIQGDVAIAGAFINLDNPVIGVGNTHTINSARLIMPRV